MTPALLIVAATLAANQPKLPPPFETKSVTKYPKVIGWRDGKTPKAPDGLTVSLYADKFDSPRWLYVLPNGDVLVAEARSLPPKDDKPKTEEEKKKEEGKKEAKSVGASANRITLLRGKDGKVVVRETFLADLNQPFGMALIGDDLYVANTDGVVRFPYKTGDTKITAKGTTVLYLTGGGYNQHWTRNLLPSADGKKLYVTVGSGSNVGEHGMQQEVLRANILEVNPDGTCLRVFASGLRNPVGMGWEPKTNALFGGERAGRTWR